MYEEEIHFGKLLLKQSEMVLEHLTLVTLTFDQVTPKSMCGPLNTTLVNRHMNHYSHSVDVSKNLASVEIDYRKYDILSLEKFHSAQIFFLIKIMKHSVVKLFRIA